MPAWLEILLLVIVAVVVLLAIGGAMANARRRRTTEGDFAGQVEAANARLAAAAAEDRGWDRAMLEAAVREAWTRSHGAEEVLELALVEVTDRPGTDADEAIFRVTGRERTAEIALARRGDAWSPASTDRR